MFLHKSCGVDPEIVTAASGPLRRHEPAYLSHPGDCRESMFWQAMHGVENAYTAQILCWMFLAISILMKYLLHFFHVIQHGKFCSLRITQPHHALQSAMPTSSFLHHPSCLAAWCKRYGQRSPKFEQFRRARYRHPCLQHSPHRQTISPVPKKMYLMLMGEWATLPRRACPGL